MARAFKLLIGAAGTLLIFFVAGFLVFAGTVMRYTPSPGAHGDGIVVLTGGEFRILEAVKLLAKGRARRLLISGVNERTSRNAIRRLTGYGEGLFNCCIDIDYARNTVGNARETKAWADNWRFSRLIIVTSSYHMPRSLAELSRALPDAKLQAYPIRPRNVRVEAWWRHPGTTRLLISEYVKFLPSLLRLGASRLLRPLENKSLTTAAAPQPAKF